MNITVFCCHNSLYAGADLAKAGKVGVKGVRTIEIPCSSRVDVMHVLKAFENGVDGVVVIACPSAACKMLRGSVIAEKRVAYLKTLIGETGLNPDRLLFVTPDVPSAPKFAEIIEEAKAVFEKAAAADAASENK